MTRREFVRKLRRTARRANGYVPPLPEDADQELDATERQLGFALPPVVRYIYKHAGQDFFSPSWPAELYRKWRPASSSAGAKWWPRKMLPLSEEGDCIWLCLDCSQRRAPVLKYRADLGPDIPVDQCFEHVAPSFVEYLRTFLSREDGGYGNS